MALICPSCDHEVPSQAWICPRCDFILDPSVLESSTAIAPAATKTTPWQQTPEEPAPEAMILGDVTVDPNDFQVLPGAGAGGDGRTTTFLFYTSGATSRVLRPDVIPTLQSDPAKVPTTPYEDFILSAIDGKRTVREVQRASGLSPQEVTITLLTLLDKRIIRIEVTRRPSSNPPPPQSETMPLPIEDLPVARPRSTAKKKAKSVVERKKEERGTKALPAGRTPFDGLPTAPDDENVVQPSALSAEDAEEVTEFAAVPRVPSLAPLPSDPTTAGQLASSPDESFEPTAGLPRVPRRGDSPLPGVPRTKSKRIGKSGVRKEPTAPSRMAEPREESPTPLPKKPAFKEQDELPRPTRLPASRPSSPPLPPIIERATNADDSAEQSSPFEPLVPTPPPAVSLQDEEEDSAANELSHATEDGSIEQPKRSLPPPLPKRSEPPPPPPPPETKEDMRAALMSNLPSAGHEKRPSASAPPPASLPSPVSAKENRPASAPLPRLDPMFLTEVPPSNISQAPALAPNKFFRLDEAPPEEPKRSTPPASPVLKKPIEERAPQKGPSAKSSEGGPSRLPPAVRSDPPAAAAKAEAKPAVQVDGVRMAKAAKLFEEALKDKAEGNLVSARMNMKLALTFDPSNALYAEAYEDLNKTAPAGGGNSTSRARQLYDDATAAERAGKVDEAVSLLERALEEAKEPAFYNRLGVLLAMKKGEFARAQKLIETALDMSPGNATYQHNLSKVLQMAAAKDVSAASAKKEEKKGILGSMFGRKK